MRHEYLRELMDRSGLTGLLRQHLVDIHETIAADRWHNGFLALGRGRFDECRQHAKELSDVATGNDYTIWATLATVLDGVALTALGRTDEGLARTETGIELYPGLTAPQVFWPMILALRGQVHALAGGPHTRSR